MAAAGAAAIRASDAVPRVLARDADLNRNAAEAEERIKTLIARLKSLAFPRLNTDRML